MGCQALLWPGNGHQAAISWGWVGEPAFAHLLEPLLGYIGIDSPQLVHGIAFFTAFFIISYLHIVVGELAPKSWAIRKPETLSLWTRSYGRHGYSQF